MRDDNDVRVIVITGKDDVFTIPPSSYGHHGDPGNDWDIMSGVTRAVEAMCTIEKPVIAKVNGHAVGFGANLVLGCDFIVAREDAIIADHHMSCGELVIDGKMVGSADHCMVTGDGGAVFAPLKMPLNMAKEYLMLARPFTAKELAAMGVVNYAVPAAELDAKTDEIAAAPAQAQRLCARVDQTRAQQAGDGVVQPWSTTPRSATNSSISTCRRRRPRRWGRGAARACCN